VPAAGFKTVFLISGAGRWLPTLLLWRFVPDEAAAKGPRRDESGRNDSRGSRQRVIMLAMVSP